MTNKTDEKVNDLVINKLTTEQYNAAKTAGTLSATELYYVLDGGISADDISGLAEVAKTNDYEDLDNLPVIGAGNLTIQKNGAQVAVFDANSTANIVANITVPTVSDTYSDSSHDAMSGVAVAEALNTVDSMKNTATGTNSLTILGTATAANNAINIGTGSQVTHNGSIQIGPGSSFTTNEFNVGFSSNNYTLLDGSTGLIPDERISSNIARTSALAGKQDTLIAGRNITIEDNVISATGGGGGGGAVDSVNGDTGAVIVKAVQNQNDTTSLLKTWVGTKNDYDAIPVKDNKTIYYIEKSGTPVDIYEELDNKQDKLTAGTGISISNQNVISATNIITVDSALSTTSENPVQNKIINTALGNKQDTISDLTTIRSNATAGKSASDTIATYGDIVSHNASEFQEKLIAGNNISIAADGKTISATDTTYTAGTNITITNGVISSTAGGLVDSVNGDTGTVVVKAIQNNADNSTMLKTWVGTKQEYDAILEKDEDTLYYVQSPGEPIDVYEELSKKQNTLIAGTNITLTTNLDDTVTISAAGGSGGSYVAGSGIDITNNTISVDTTTIATKAELPTDVSDLNNDAGYISSVPTASSSVLGGIKVGTNLTIDANGVLSANTQSGAVDSVNGDTGTVVVKAVQNNADNSSMLKTWVGTKSDYDSILIKDPNTLYYVKTPGTSIDIYQELDNKQDKLTAGTGINITSNTISVTTPVLENIATGELSVSVSGGIASSTRASTNIGVNSSAVAYATAIGRVAVADGSSSIAIGENVHSNSTGSIAIGAGSTVTGYGAIAIGSRGTVNGAGAIILGNGSNTEASTFKVALNTTNVTSTDEASGLYTLLDSSGHIPTGRLAEIIITGTSAPTTATVGVLGQIYKNTATGKLYLCTVVDSITPAYTWSELLTSDAINNMQTTTNLVTSISSASTDTQYASAKCVYDIIGDVETLLSNI